MAARDKQRKWARLVIGAVALLAGLQARAEPLAIIGILEGGATLVRQTTRFTLVEGAALSDGDIVETAPDTYAQIEFDDGAVIGLGGGSRVILKPKLTNLKPTGAPRLYLLEGWMKLNAPQKPHAGFDWLSPAFELDSSEAAVVTRVQPKSYAVFIESGNARLLERGGARAGSDLKGGDFAAQAENADKAAITQRMDPKFIEQMPRFYRDHLPARAALYAKRTITLKPVGPIEYADVSPWLHTEPGVRLALSKQWRSRASDRAFRAELAANLAAHMEWERVLYPERFLPKKPPPPKPPASAASLAAGASD